MSERRRNRGSLNAFGTVVLFGVGLALCSDDPFRSARERMIAEQIEARGVTSATVLQAMRSVRRELFVPDEFRAYAYGDHPLPIGSEQTISQPFIVALMTQLLAPAHGQRVLEIGTGSGYQAAILSTLVKEVDTIEIVPELGRSAAERLRRLGYANVQVRIGDGYLGWPEKAPFDRIILTASPPEIPTVLIDQLKSGGILVAPVGVGMQFLTVVDKAKDGKTTMRSVLPVVFVPMKGATAPLRKPRAEWAASRFPF